MTTLCHHNVRIFLLRFVTNAAAKAAFPEVRSVPPPNGVPGRQKLRGVHRLQGAGFTVRGGNSPNLQSGAGTRPLVRVGILPLGAGGPSLGNALGESPSGVGDSPLGAGGRFVVESRGITIRRGNSSSEGKTHLRGWWRKRRLVDPAHVAARLCRVGRSEKVTTFRGDPLRLLPSSRGGVGRRWPLRNLIGRAPRGPDRARGGGRTSPRARRIGPGGLRAGGPLTG
eukprot:1186191-Prorocentrum_minimum.AAC.2